MRKNYIMASLACLGLVLAFQNTNAQTQVIIANGGKFEFVAPYADKATIGSYDLSTNTYSTFDTIQVESVNGLVIDGNVAFLGAGDSLIKYDIDNYTRSASTSISGVKDVHSSGGQLFVSFYNYIGAPLMKSIDKITLAPLFDFNGLESNVGDVAIINDSIYITSNILGTLEQNPGWGDYLDSLGIISVFNANTGAFSRKIELGVDGAGVNDLVIYNNKLFSTCEESGNVLEYDPATDTQSYTSINLEGLVDSYNNILIVETTTGIDKFDMDTKLLLNQGFSQTYTASAYNNISDKYYFTQTDFSTYGKTFIHDATGLAIDSFNVAVSPEGIAIDFRIPVGVEEDIKISNEFSIYPNPAKENISVRLKNKVNNLQVIDIAGRVLISRSNLLSGIHNMKLSNLNSGIYLVKISSETETKVERFIKQ
ncbi:MAG: T9SS type A sorting domain-containing protein [Flavobacteriales bacterium]